MTSNKVLASSTFNKEDSKAFMIKHRPLQLMELLKCSKHHIKVNSRRAVVEISASKSSICTASRLVAIHKQMEALWATHRSRHSPIDSNLCPRLPRNRWPIIVIRLTVGYRSNNRLFNKLEQLPSLILEQAMHVRTLKISIKLLSKEVSVAVAILITITNK